MRKRKIIIWSAVIICVIVAIIAICDIMLARNASGNTYEDVVRGLPSDIKEEIDIQTKYTWVDNEGNEYPIFISKKGECFVVKVDNTGKLYKHCLPIGVKVAIMKELDL